MGGAYALTFAGTGTATITPSYGGVTLPSFTINNVAHSTNAQRLDLITTTSSIDEALGCERITITAGNSGPTTTFSLMYANEANYADNIGTGGTQGTNYLTAAQVIQALTITYLV